MKTVIQNGMVVITMTEEEYFSKFNPQIVESVKEIPKEKNLFTETTNFLNYINVPSHLKGFNYLRDAIMMCFKDHKAMVGVTKTLYPTIAIQNNDLPSRVERVIRHAIESTWTSENVEVLNSICGTNLDSSKKLSNSRFIALAANYLRAN